MCDHYQTLEDREKKTEILEKGKIVRKNYA